MNYIERLRNYAPKALIRGKYQHGNDCCVIGVCVPQVLGSAARDEHTYDPSIRSLALTRPSVAKALQDAELSNDDAYNLQHLNDYLICDNTTRYATVMRVLALVEAGRLSLVAAAELADTRTIADFEHLLADLEQNPQAVP